MSLAQRYSDVLINIDEMWLKGKNRPLYFRAIKDHISRCVKATTDNDFSIENQNSRLFLRSQQPFSRKTLQQLQKIPGIGNLVPALKVERSINYIETIMPVAQQMIRPLLKSGLTFKVFTQRVDKSFPVNSMQICRQIGHQILQQFPELKVDVKNPDLSFMIKITSSGIYLSTEKMAGMGGLPVGTSGHLITLLSGGFDSPVASYMMAKRGCRQTFIFFYAYPFVGEEVKKKILDLVGVLGQFQKKSQLYVIPFGDLQKQIADKCPAEYRTILFRKYMLECSNILANKLGAQALLTGDSLGQVSSQTIDNIALMDSSSTKPILRPLIGLNKSEIIALSRQIGTHDISVVPHDDACSLFAAKHPIIRPNLKFWDKMLGSLNFAEQLPQMVDAAEVFQISLLGDLLN